MAHSAYDHADTNFDGIESYGSELPSRTTVHGVLASIALCISFIVVAIYHFA